jgi:hypothetical protein
MEELKLKVKEVLDNFIKLYKFPAEIFLDIFKIEEEKDKLKAYVKIDPRFKFEYPVITPSEFVILLQKFVPHPYGIIDNKELYFYFVLGEVEKKAQTDQPPVEFQATVLDELLDRVARPIIETGIPDLLIGWWAAKNIAKNISEMFQTLTLPVNSTPGYVAPVPKEI